MSDQEKKVSKRDDKFVDRQATKIWKEIPDAENPFLASGHVCFGYDLLELLEKRSFADVFFLLFCGKLPSSEQAQLFESLMIALINPGPRHPATRAGINAAIGKTDSFHFLPISLSILGGEHLGAQEVEKAMRFLKKNLRQNPDDVLSPFIAELRKNDQLDWRLFPGFGQRFSSRDPFACKLGSYLTSLPGAGRALQWGEDLSRGLADYSMGWLIPGIAAATFIDLGFNALAGPGLFQILCAPGILAHSVEYANKPITHLPFISDENYVIEK